MSLTIGIDIGGSTTKIVGIKDGMLQSPLVVKATDPITSVFGAFGKFTEANGLSLKDIKQVMVTGVGASYVKRKIFDLPTGIVPEFLANGLGGLYLSGLESSVIVSMGTGTALVKADDLGITYMGGTAIGGGTIIGLARRMLNVSNFETVIELAKKGNLGNIDLTVGDLTSGDLPGLAKDITASNFGKICDNTSGSDIALGILNLVFQTIGMISVFALRSSGLKKVVLIGTLSQIPQCRDTVNMLRSLTGEDFIIPENSEFGTAIGTALAFVKDKEFTELS